MWKSTFLQLPGKHTNLRAVWRLVREFRDGYLHLACAVPVTMLRGALFLLVCFEVASLLEVCSHTCFWLFILSKGFNGTFGAAV